MMPKRRPEITKSSKWLPKRPFGEKVEFLRLLETLGSSIESFLGHFGSHFGVQIEKKCRRKAVRKSVSKKS